MNRRGAIKSKEVEIKGGGILGVSEEPKRGGRGAGDQRRVP